MQRYETLHFTHAVYLCVPSDLTETDIIPSYNINWLVFVTDTDCVLCEVETEAIHVIRIIGSLQMVNNVREINIKAETICEVTWGAL
jgi:hypothetical protein